MDSQPHAALSLYASGGRKYLNATERRRFLAAAREFEPKTRLFCEVLAYSGARLSEVLALTPAAVDLDDGAIRIATLKRRKRVFRQVPLPRDVVRRLNRAFDLRRLQHDLVSVNVRLWEWCRCTGWRRVKRVMTAAQIVGATAMPKGLRHGFGVAAIRARVPQHLLQRWLGHASPRTTAIYGDVMGPEERAVAARMWR